jgi:hypothetical protein
MRTLKIVCLLFCLLSVASIIAGGHAVRPAPFGTPVTGHGSVGMIWSFVNAVVFAGTFYGIHTRAPITWKLGWGVIVVGLLEFLYEALSSTMKLPETAHPWIASAAVLIGGAAVALYWGLWWKRQKPYFARRSDAD